MLLLAQGRPVPGYGWHKGVVSDMQRTILVVDDDEDIRSALRAVLEGDGYEVVEAADGTAALAYLVGPDALLPALIVLDLMMPQMSGWEFLSIVKSYVRLAKVPIVVVSAVHPSLAALHRGSVTAALMKPCDHDELLAVVRALVPTG
jgi:CheY-like chemotaxis protein